MTSQVSKISPAGSPRKTHAIACVFFLCAFLLVGGLNGCDDASAPNLTDARDIRDLSTFTLDENDVESFQAEMVGVSADKNQNFNDIELTIVFDSAPEPPVLDITLSTRRTPANGSDDLERPGNPEEWALDELEFSCKAVPANGSPIVLSADPRVADDRAAGFEFGILSPPDQSYIIPSGATPVELCELRAVWNPATRRIEFRLTTTTRQLLPSTDLELDFTMTAIVPAD